MRDANRPSFPVLLAFLALGVLLVGSAEGQSLPAQPLPPTGAVAYGKQTNRLPAWATPGDRYFTRLDLTSKSIYLCIEDSDTGDRWTAGSSLQSYAEFLSTGKWRFREGRPVTAADIAICWGAP